MISFKENTPLQNFNTFGVQANARFFVELHTIDDVQNLLTSDLIHHYPFFVLGGGSNVLFTGDFEGLIVHPLIKGIEKTAESETSVTIRVGAGEIWDSLVDYCVANQWSGIENLSLIPGSVGASPVQNIGAYGVEVMDCIDSVEYYQLKNARFIKCTAHECEFSYRNSIFKNELKNQVIITHVNFRLNKNPEFHTGYPDLKKELDNYPETTIANIRSAIITIRQKKLPDPVVTGNAGSFFKNPVIEKEQAYALTRHYPTIPLFDNPDGRIKLSAAWLIEQCGWKGKIWGNTGTYKNQPLILINRGGATGSEIYQCAQKIRKAVMNHFAIKLGMEVNVL